MFQHFLVCLHEQSPATVLQGLGEDMTKPKSRLEREKEAAAAAAAKPGSTSEVRKSSTTNVRSKVAEAWQGQGLESVLHKRKSKLEQDKENAASAAASTSPKEIQKPGAAARSAVTIAGIKCVVAGHLVKAAVLVSHQHGHGLHGGSKQ